MTNNAQALLNQALHLSESERAELAGALLQSLEPSTDDPAEIEAAWRREVAERVRAYEAGEVEMIPWEEVREQLFANLRGHTDG